MERPILKPIGTPAEQLDTPALVVDLDALESNIEKIHANFRQSDVKLRPYAESHRCPAIAHKQLAAGGTVSGIGVASVGEAEVFAQNGISDILVTNQVVTASKIGRLCALARQSKITIVADNQAIVNSFSEATQNAGVTLNVVANLNMGQERSGIAPGQPALELARSIVQANGLNFSGLMSLDDGDPSDDADELSAKSHSRIQATLDTRQLLEQDGIDVGAVCVNAPHLNLGAEMSGVTEVLAGAYALMDHRHSTVLPGLDQAAKVLAAVTSLPEPGTAILDTGRKAMGDDYGFPVIDGRDGLQVVSMSAEHGKLQWDELQDVSLALGDRIWFTPMDIGACVNVYDYMQAVRNGKLEAVLSVAARGIYR